MIPDSVNQWKMEKHEIINLNLNPLKVNTTVW